MRLKKEILFVNSYEELIQRVKSKHQTYSKISGALLQILCNYTKQQAQKNQKLEYIRLLAFNSKGKDYLNTIKKDLTLPLISKISKNKNEMLELELNTTKIYTLPYKNNEQNYKKEYQCDLYRKDDQND